MSNTPDSGPDPRPENDPYSQPSSDQPPAYQPPSGQAGNEQLMNADDTLEPPKSIKMAVKLMLVGAAISLIGAIVSLASKGQISDAVQEEVDAGTIEIPAGSSVDAMVNATIGAIVVVSIIAVALWLWMAWANNKGKSWARVVATVLGGLNIVLTLLSFVGGMGQQSGLSLFVNVILVVLAAAILWLLYKPESGQYYAAVTRAKQ